MIIKETYPPNYKELNQVLGPLAPHKPVFTYGDVIYNPFGREITPDIEYHEKIHSKQQGQYPEVWYYKYLYDKKFRLEQEIEAYGFQYLYAKKHVSGKLLEWVRKNMAEALSGAAYGNLLSYGQAESKIRNYKIVQRLYNE